MASEQSAKAAVVEAYISAFSAGDAAAAARLFAPDATVEDPVGTPLVTGDGIPALYRSAMARGLRLERTGPVRFAGDSAAFPFAIHYPPSAARRRIDVIDIFRFDSQGRIIEMRAFWGPDNIHTSQESPNHA